MAYTEVLADETGRTAAAFWRRAEAWFRAHGVVVKRVLTDNHFSYRGRLFNAALAATGVAHRYCKPYRPQTNGKVGATPRDRGRHGRGPERGERSPKWRTRQDRGR